MVKRTMAGIGDREVPLSSVPLETNSPQLLSTFWRGVNAFHDGVPRIEANRIYDHTAFRNFWRKGWDAAADREDT